MRRKTIVVAKLSPVGVSHGSLRRGTVLASCEGCREDRFWDSNSVW